MRKWFGNFDDLRGYYRDFWSDFLTTVEEVAKEHSFPQMMAVTAVVFLYTLCIIGMWVLLSLLLALIVWPLWNNVMPHLGLPEIGYWHAYCLTLLSAILIRGNSNNIRGEEE